MDESSGKKFQVEGGERGWRGRVLGVPVLRIPAPRLAEVLALPTERGLRRKGVSEGGWGRPPRAVAQALRRLPLSQPPPTLGRRGCGSQPTWHRCKRAEHVWQRPGTKCFTVFVSPYRSWLLPSRLFETGGSKKRLRCSWPLNRALWGSAFGVRWERAGGGRLPWRVHVEVPDGGGRPDPRPAPPPREDGAFGDFSSISSGFMGSFTVSPRM